MTIRNLAAAAIAGPLLFAALVLLQDILQYDYLVEIGADPLTVTS